MIAGVALMLAWPWAVGPKPALTAPRKELAQWGVHSLIYVSVLIALFLSAAFAATLMIRRQRNAFLQESTKNLTELVKGTLEDHAKKNP